MNAYVADWDQRAAAGHDETLWRDAVEIPVNGRPRTAKWPASNRALRSSFAFPPALVAVSF